MDRGGRLLREARTAPAYRLGCAGIVRTCHWHERSIVEASARYGAAVWAKPPPDCSGIHPFDHAATPGEDLPGGLQALDVERGDEVALWLPDQAAEHL